MKAFWCEQAVIDGTIVADVRIRQEEGVIVSVQRGVEAVVGDAVLRGVVLPGLANVHSHAFHRALRGTTHADGGTFWNWRERMYAVSAALTPENYRTLARAVFAEMVSAGFTLVGEFHYVHGRPDGSPYDDADMERSLLAAAREAGIRITLLDALYLRGGLTGRGETVPLSPEQRRFSDGSVTAWEARRERLSGSRTALIGAAVHSVRAVDAEDLAHVARSTRGVPLHAHVSEQPAENEQVHAATGRTPTRCLADAGLLDEGFTAVHATHLSDADVALLGAARAGACFCPTTERDLADGIGPGRALHGAGARLCLGSDQHAVVDPFEEIRGLEMDERLASGERGRFSPAELLAAATSAGYRSLGWDGGSIDVGSVCDLVAVSPRSPRTAGVAAEQLWLAATGADVTDVVVDGRAIVKDGVHLLGDVGRLLADAIEAVRS
ncbi:formimidoylglutamate deiminase [Microbacterium tumbae]